MKARTVEVSFKDGTKPLLIKNVVSWKFEPMGSVYYFFGDDNRIVAQFSAGSRDFVKMIIEVDTIEVKEENEYTASTNTTDISKKKRKDQINEIADKILEEDTDGN